MPGRNVSAAGAGREKRGGDQQRPYLILSLRTESELAFDTVSRCAVGLAK